MMDRVHQGFLDSGSASASFVFFGRDAGLTALYTAYITAARCISWNPALLHALQVPLV
jgi:hypothetical protein